MHFKVPYLNFAIVTCENTLHQYLNTNKASELCLYFLKGSHKNFNKILILKSNNIPFKQNVIILHGNQNDEENLSVPIQSTNEKIDIEKNKKIKPLCTL